MATVNLGSIKFNWQGAYNGATAYAVDDVVSSSGSSYVCIAATTGNAPPNATYWELMSQAGTDGTDLTTTLTTQGDLVYYNGSALARLGAGTSGQVLQTGGTGANPSWTTISSAGIQQYIKGTVKTDTYNSTSTSFVSMGVGATITPSSTSSKILILVTFGFEVTSGGDGSFNIYRGGSLSTGGTGGTSLSTGSRFLREQGDSRRVNGSFHFLDAPNTTSATTYALYGVTTDSAYQLSFNNSNRDCFMDAIEISGV
jgi:hypothetical protein